MAPSRHYGETVVLRTVVAAKTPARRRRLPPADRRLHRKTYAAGRIPGGYFKREGRSDPKKRRWSSA